MNVKFAIVLLGASSIGFAQQIPPPPPPLPPMVPTLTSPSQQAATAAVRGNEVIVSITTNRGSDPTKWHIAPRVTAIPAMRAMPTREERLDQLRLRLGRLEDEMLADGYRFTIDGLVCALGPNSCVLDEERSEEIQDLAIAIANTRRDIDIIREPEVANHNYLAAMKVLQVPPPGDQVITSNTTAHGFTPQPAPTPPPPPVQATTLKNCSPVWETRTSWVLTPKMVGYTAMGDPQYVYQYQPVRNPVVTYPSGCN